MPSLAARPGLARDEGGGQMNEAYRQTGHKYLWKNVSRGGRQRSKVLKSLKNIASLGLIDQVMREDDRRRRDKEREAMVSC